MTFADGVIVFILAVLVGLVLYILIKNRNQNCAGCAYAKNCETYCVKIKPEETK